VDLVAQNTINKSSTLEIHDGRPLILDRLAQASLLTRVTVLTPYYKTRSFSNRLDPTTIVLSAEPTEL